ncbi:MAG: hypothetical protein GQ535_14690 [Rhodobacteraceae bacterium]|nr:hypothetical protein [Paracoccaceae bacterium]
MKPIIAFAIALAIASPISAQSVSLEDLQRQIAAELAQSNQYAELLNNPDPAHSLAAMKVMLRSGDPILVDLAMNYGLYSPNPAVRRAALDGYFASEPVLEMEFDASELRFATSLAQILGMLGGSVSADRIGFASVKLGGWDDKNSCYAAQVSEELFLDDGCFLRNSENGVSLFLWRRWWHLELNDQGALSGSGNTRISNVRDVDGLPIRLQIAQ